MASRPVVNMDNFEEGLGRIMYVAGALEYERPFLAPLYKFLNVHPRGSTRKLPSYVAFILRHLLIQVERERHFSCATQMLPTDISPRVDAQASETRTGNGGWLLVLNARGVPDPWLSPWFSVEITPEVLPWVYEKGGKPSLIISTLEALAVLVSLKMFYGEQPASGKKKVTVAPTWTDNRGNGSALNIDDNEVPSVRSTHGIVSIHEAHVHEGGCRVDPQSRQSRGRSFGERRTQSIQPAESCRRGSRSDAVGCFARCLEPRKISRRRREKAERFRPVLAEECEASEEET